MGSLFIPLAIASVAAFMLIIGGISIEDAIKHRGQ
jgi:hypothetical protein